MNILYRISILLAFCCLQQSAFAQVDTAHFFVSSSSGSCTYKIFHLQSSSTPGYTSLRWNLGNGTVITTTVDSVTALYTLAGTYHVTLTAFYPGDSATYGMDLVMPNNVDIAFDADDTLICPGTTVHFNNTSTAIVGTPVTYSWLINGSTFTTASPNFTFTAAGYYDVKLTATNNVGCSDILVKHNYIHVTAAPDAAFTISPQYICHAPFTSTYHSTSTGNAPLSYSWHFAAGPNVSTTTDPYVYTYPTLPTSRLVWLIVTDANGCKDSISHTVYNDSIRAAFTVDSPVCQFSPLTFHSTGFYPSTTGRTPYYTWLYGDGSSVIDTTTTTAAHAYADSAMRTVTLIVHNEYCADTAVRAITVHPKPDADFTMPLSCSNATSVTFTPNTAYPYVLWKVGFATPVEAPTLTTTVPYGGTTVKMTIADAYGCRDTVVKRDSVYGVMLAIIEGTNINPVDYPANDKYDGCGPAVHFEAQAKTAQFTSWWGYDPYPSEMVYFSWNFDDGTPVISGPGLDTLTHIYNDTLQHYPTCTVTMANGCSFTKTASVKLHVAPYFHVTAAPTHICGNEIVTFTVHIDSGSAEPTYDWRFGDGLIQYGEGTTYFTTYPAAGVYVATVTAYGGGCARNKRAVDTIFVDSGVARASLVYDCADHLLIHLNTDMAGIDSLLWTFSDGTAISDDSFDHGFPVLGSQTATLTVHNNATGCRDTAIFNFVLYDIRPTMGVTDSAFCLGGANICGAFTEPPVPDPFVRYCWYVDSELIRCEYEILGPFGMGNGSSILDSFPEQGTHSIVLVALDDHNCLDSTTQYVYVSTPDAGFTTVSKACAGDSILIQDTSAYLFNRTLTRLWWLGTDTLTADTTILRHAFGAASYWDSATLTLTVTDNVGCTDTAQKKLYIYKPFAKFTPRKLYACVGVKDSFANASLSKNALRYNWDFGDGGTSIAKSPTHIFNATGDYAVRLTIIDTVLGCTDDTVVIIHVSQVTAAITMSDTLTKCRPHNVDFAATGTNSDTGWLHYLWKINDQAVYDQYHTETYVTAGIDPVMLIDSNIHGCRDTAYATMAVLGFAGDFYVSTHIGCSPVTVTLAVPHSTDSLRWYAGGIEYDGLDTVVQTFGTPGLYTATLIRRDSACESISVDSIRVDTLMPAINAAHTGICPGQADSFFNASVSLFSTVATTHWDFGDGATSGLSTGVHAYGAPGTYMVTMTTASALGCSGTATYTVTVYPAPQITGMGHSTPVCTGETLTLYDTVSGGAPGYAYGWSGPGGYISAEQYAVRTPLTTAMAGTYVLVVIDTNGCRDTATVAVPLSQPTPVIGGPVAVCQGGTIAETASAGGGTWTLSNSNATVSSTGVVTGVSAGTVIVTYTLVGACGSSVATRLLTVNATPTITPSPTSVCVSFTRPLAGSPTGSAYVWSSVTTSIVTVNSIGRIGGAATGTGYIRYTNTVTGCYATDTVTVNPLPAPIEVTPGTVVCNGDTIIVKDPTPGGHWSSASSSILLVPVAPVAGYVDTGVRGVGSAASTVTYTLASTGCYVTRNVYPAYNPSATLSPTVQSYCTGYDTLKVTATGGLAPYTYSWTPDATLANLTGARDSVSGLTTTHIYTVTVTDAKGCRARATATVVPVCAEVCAAGLPVTALGAGSNIPAGTYSSVYYLDNMATSVIQITGVDSFIGAVVAVAPGKTIQVSSGGNMVMLNSHFYSCRTDTMWQGIKVVGKVYAGQNTLIEDAQIAMYADNTPAAATDAIRCDGVVFNRNKIGIWLLNYTGTTYPWSISNTVFTSRNMTGYYDGTHTYPFAWPGTFDLKMPYTPSSGSVVQPPFNIDNPVGKYTASGAAAYTRVQCKAVSVGDALMGLDISNVGPNSSASFPGLFVRGGLCPNYTCDSTVMFDNLVYGVYDTLSHFTITGSIFMYCHPNTSGGAGGAGIWAGNGFSTGRYQLSVNAPSAYAGDHHNNKFYNCKYGVYANNMKHVYGLYNEMYSDHTKFGDSTYGKYGYKITNMATTDLTTAATLELNGNYFGNIDSCIHYLVQDALTGNMHMCRNQFIATPPYWSGYTSQAIYASSTAASGSNVGTLHTDSNEVYLAANGIYLNGFKRKTAFTNNNSIWLALNYTPTYGIRHTSCLSNVIRQNYVKSSDVQLVSYATGISGESNTTATMSCNDVNHLQKGFNFNGTANTTTWRNNIMDTCRYGFHINNGYIGVGLDTVHAFDNKWPGGWPSGTFHTFNNGSSTAFLSRMFVRVNSGGLIYDPYINSDVSGGGTSATFGYPAICTSLSCFASSIVHAPDSVTNNCTPTNVEFPTEIDYLPGVMDTIGGSDTGEIKQRTTVGNGAYLPQRIKWVTQMHIWSAVLAYPMLSDSSMVLGTFREEALNSRYGWLTNIAAALDDNDIVAAQVLMNDDIDAHVNTNTDAVTGVVMADGVEADYVVGNYLSYYDQYIKYLNNTMNIEDSSIVFALAGLCPFTDGEIVYSARTLAAALGTNVNTNDEDCAAAAAGKGNPSVYNSGHFEGSAEQKYKLYPNPNNGTITISELIDDDKDVQAEVIDAMGRIVYTGTLQFSNRNVHLQLQNTIVGLYLLKLTNADGKTFSFKFVVQ